jgi:hypothetical protein
VWFVEAQKTFDVPTTGLNRLLRLVFIAELATMNDAVPGRVNFVS